MVNEGQAAGVAPIAQVPPLPVADIGPQPPEPLAKGADEKFCHECGAVIRARAEICPACGVRQPTEREAPGRFEGEPHRGTAILVMGVLSLFVFPLPFGLIAWLWANEDLRKMRNGLMDPEGRGTTQAGKICGMISTILSLSGCCCLLGWFLIPLLWLGLAGSRVYELEKQMKLSHSDSPPAVEIEPAKIPVLDATAATGRPGNQVGAAEDEPAKKWERELEDEKIGKGVAEVIQAPPTRQAQIIKELRDGKGVVYTLALANVIPNLNDDAKKQARETLVERLTHTTPATLDAKLRDPHPEIRRAAALACARKDDKTHIPRLIQTLRDREQAVGTAAREALKALSGGEDFGPPPGAGYAEQQKAVADWVDWWKSQPQK
jgi:hypothetical protein